MRIKRRRSGVGFAACVTAMLWAAAASADDDSWARDDPWSISAYVGPATTKYVGAIVQSFNFHPTSAMFGVTVDRRIVNLGDDIWISGEIEGEAYRFGHHDMGYGAGLGFLVNEPFGFKRTSFSVYDGPSWDTDPPYQSIGYKEQIWPSERKRFLNYISLEYAVALSRSGRWDGIVRLFHRSGMFGVFSRGDDEGAAIGLGLRCRF